MNSTAGRTTGPPPAAAERADAGEAEAEEDRVEIGEELGQRHVAAEPRPWRDA